MIRGIQVILGILLAIEAYKMISTRWLIGIASILIVLLLRKNRHVPAAIILMLIGIVIMLFKGQFAQTAYQCLLFPP